MARSAVGLVVALATASCQVWTAPVPEAAPSQRISVSLITKDAVNPFFLAMHEGARRAASDSGVDLTVAAAAGEGDDEGQIAAVDAAVAAGQDGILITPLSAAVNDALRRARSAGLYVIALDTPPEPASTVDITFATDNRQAGRLIGRYAAAALRGRKAVIALLDVYDDRTVSVDVDRDQGFLEGMGIEVADPNRNGDEARTGRYTSAGGGTYEIVGNAATQANAVGGQREMRRLLSRAPRVNVVYTVNEPAAEGAARALRAARRGPGDHVLVSVDGGRAGVRQVADGTVLATAQQYPLRMAELAVLAVVVVASGGARPQNTPGLDFFDTGVALIARTPVGGVNSKTPDFGLQNAWG